MKIYIKSAKVVPNEYVIDVVYNVPFPINASKVVMCSDDSVDVDSIPDEQVDKQALMDYDAFIDNVYDILCNYFEVVDLKPSDINGSASWYFYIYAKDKNGDVATKFIIRLRISDHEYTERHSAEAEKRFVNDDCQKYKRPADKKHQRWHIKNIVVDGDEYGDYSTALERVEEDVIDLNRKYVNKK